jgi:acyl-CoA synthetase (NDP forming)
MFHYLEQYRIGFSTGISVGNEAVVDIVECMEYLAACPHTKVIGLYIESIRRGRAFIETARRIVPHKPIVAYYAGGSEAGRRAAFSHTGAMAGPDQLYDGVFRQSGVIRAASLTELFDFCWVLGRCASPQGRHIAVLTHSGGPGAAAADAASRNHLELTPFAPPTLAKLKSMVPQTGSVNNPVDLTFSRDPLDYFRRIPGVLLEAPEVDGLLVYCFVPPKNMQRMMENQGLSDDELDKLTDAIADELAANAASIADTHQKPIIGFTYQSTEMPIIRKLLEHGIPVIPTPERAVRAMMALAQYGERVAKIISQQ